MADKQLLEIVGGTIFVKDAPTYIKGRAYGLITDGQKHQYNGSDAGNQRKQIVISNNDATGRLYIAADGGIILAIVQPATSFTIITSASLQVWNNSGATIDYAALETFYLPQK